ncbi:MAG: U32 family peptidase, partial [Eggerthellaceae bacterium]|nr:U32 family peptidase [Eggerthellaceae bacterium]
MANKPELLAPAGNEACLHAAVSAGADAVYLGLDEFNARRNADNFTLETLPAACEYAHLRGTSIYVTMNIEILPSEFDRAVKLARGIRDAGADGVIVQDIGLAAELVRAVPDLPLHVSTQMNTHSAAGIEAAARLGAKRVTLARELSLAEIADLAQIAADFGMEIETFAHGALCVCYSGQCLMSSMIGGRSANRGLCAQACRLPYELHSARHDGALPAPGEHLLSPRDLCTIDLLDQLADAGVASLKIEGRMKSADYVHEVVSVYREVLDSGESATDAHRARLAEAFSRGFTTAYLEGQRGNDIMSYGRPNNRGVFAGRVTRVADGFAEVKPEIELNDGDVLEFWTNKGHFASTLTSARPGKGGVVSVPVEQRVGKGDRVFRVRNAATAFEDDPMQPRIPVRGRVELNIGAPTHIVFEATAKTGATCTGEAWGDEVELARTRPVEEADVRSHVDRLGTTPFVVENEDDL